MCFMELSSMGIILVVFAAIFGWGCLWLSRFPRKVVLAGAYPVGLLFVGMISALLNFGHIHSLWILIPFLSMGLLFAGWMIWKESVRLPVCSISVCAIGLFCGVAFLFSSAPPVRPDSLVYHLALPKIYLEKGGWIDTPANIYSYFPNLMESLYLVLMRLGVSSPQGLHALTGMMVLVLTWFAARKAELSRCYSWVAVWGVLLTPEFFKEMTWAYVDLANVLYWTWGVLLFLEWQTSRKGYWIGLMGVAIAGAMSVKYTSLLFPLILILLILLEVRKDRGVVLTDVFRRLVGMAFLCAVLTCWWWGKNWLVTGAPLFPFFVEIFDSHHSIWDSERIQLLMMYVNQYGGAGDGSLFRRIMGFPVLFLSGLPVFQARFDGAFNFWLICSFGSLYWLRKSVYLKVIWLVLLVKCSFWVFSSQQTRFALEMVPFLSVMAAFFLQRISNRQGWFRSIVALFIIISVCNIVGLFFYFRGRDYWTGIRPGCHESYMRTRLPYFGVYAFINEQTPENAVVGMVLTGANTYYLDRPFFTDTVFEERMLKVMLEEASDVDDVLLEMRKAGWDYLLTYIPASQPPMWLDVRYHALLRGVLKQLPLIYSENGFLLFEIPAEEDVRVPPIQKYMRSP